MINNSLYKELAKKLNLGDIISIETIQTLWSGYGELVRLIFKNKSIIVKHIKLPKKSEHPRGWNTNFSHQRKIHSYEVEVNWYENFSKEKDQYCPIPKGLKTLKKQNEWLIVMEDLKELGYKNTTITANKNHLQSCLYWLANFHAKYMNIKSDLLWDIGTYWHLDTRPDEFEVMQEGDLKKYAKQIDEILNNTKYQTIVHGDAKLANFCFNTDATKCAAIDFQYVGHGCGMKDVIYFISSAVNPSQCKKMEKWLLDTYFKALNKALNYYKKSLDNNKIEQEWRELYAIAWADFQRFLNGWSPEHFKINPYTKEITLQALSNIKSKKIL